MSSNAPSALRIRIPKCRLLVLWKQRQHTNQIFRLHGRRIEKCKWLSGYGPYEGPPDVHDGPAAVLALLEFISGDVVLQDRQSAIAAIVAVREDGWAGSGYGVAVLEFLGLLLDRAGQVAAHEV